MAYKGGSPGGGTNGGNGGLPGGYPGMGGGSGSGSGGSIALTRTPTFQKTKDISYGTTDQIYSASATVAADEPSGTIPNLIEVQNNGSVPLMVLVGYETFSNETTDSGATRYLHVMLMPGETYNPRVRAVIHTSAGTAQFIGTAVSNTAPDSNEYTDSGAATTEGFADDDDTTITFDKASDGSVAHNMFRVNDLIRLDDEVVRITSIVDTAGDGDYTPAHFIVERALYGTAKADHTNNTAIRFPFFNAYHDYDKYSVAQTDSSGRFKAMNFFGVGRAASGVQGIIPGSVAIKFYDAGYQELGLSGITSSTTTSLAAGGSYWFKIAIDGGTAESINFTTDTSNVNWGGTNGVLSKIQSALDDKYNNSASNTFQQRSTVSIVNGDVRFTSGQRLSTSAIALTAGVDGASAAYNWFAQQNGHIPTLASLDAAVDARLPDDVKYDPITYVTSYNNVFGYDDGYGRIKGMCSGTINYETGAIDLKGCPVNAEFVYSVADSSAFSGKLNTGANAIVEILVNTPSQKRDGSVKLSIF